MRSLPGIVHGDVRVRTQVYRTAMGRSVDGAEIATLCTKCSDELTSSMVDTGHMIQFLAGRIDSLSRMDRPMRVAIGPGCSAMKFGRETRTVVEVMGFKVVNQTISCCGKNASMEGSLIIEKEEECAGVGWIVVGYPMCLVKFNTYLDGISVMHTSELVALAAGTRPPWSTTRTSPESGFV